VKRRHRIGFDFLFQEPGYYSNKNEREREREQTISPGDALAVTAFAQMPKLVKF
jgi:hypothetical protein